MTTSQLTPFLAEVVSGRRIPEEKLAYFRARLKNRLHAFVITQFAKLESQEQFTRADLARRLGKKPEQITRWLGAPGNWTLDTLSDLLLGMGYEPNLSAANLREGAIRPQDEAWRRGDDELPSQKAVETEASKEPAKPKADVIWLGNRPKPPMPQVPVDQQLPEPQRKFG